MVIISNPIAITEDNNFNKTKLDDNFYLSINHILKQIIKKINNLQ